MHDLKKTAEECIRELKAIDIPIQDEKIRNIIAVPLHKDKCVGHCIITEDGGFSIEIWNEMLGDGVDLITLKNLICHELLHTCDGCMNHKGTFRRYSRKIDKFYDYGMMTGDDDYLHPEKPVLDRFQCTKCKYIHLYRKESNSQNARAIKAISENLLSQCPYCGGKMTHTPIS